MQWPGQASGRWLARRRLAGSGGGPPAPQTGSFVDSCPYPYFHKVCHETRPRTLSYDPLRVQELGNYCYCGGLWMEISCAIPDLLISCAGLTYSVGGLLWRVGCKRSV